MDDELTGIPADLSAGTLIRKLGIRIVEVSESRVVGTMPVQGNVQPQGLLHGGASAALAETLGSLGAAAHIGSDKIAVGVDLSITHHRAVTRGTVTGVATPLYLGRSTATYDIAITNDDGERVATARLTCALRPKPGI